MVFQVRNEPAPIAVDADGVVRVGSTRVTLDSVIYAFRKGATPEEIAQQYPALSLVDVYGAVAYYLRFQDETDAYIGTTPARN